MGTDVPEPVPVEETRGGETPGDWKTAFQEWQGAFQEWKEKYGESGDAEK